MRARATVKATARPCGVELELAGPCIWLSLRHEKGYQHWETAVKNEFAPFSIQVRLHPGATPDGIHRQAFYAKHKPRRTVRGSFVTDIKLDISREMPAGGMVAFFAEKLDEAFTKSIKNAFLGEGSED